MEKQSKTTQARIWKIVGRISENLRKYGIPNMHLAVDAIDPTPSGVKDYKLKVSGGEISKVSIGIPKIAKRDQNKIELSCRLAIKIDFEDWHEAYDQEYGEMEPKTVSHSLGHCSYGFNHVPMHIIVDTKNKNHEVSIPQWEDIVLDIPTESVLPMHHYCVYDTVKAHAISAIKSFNLEELIKASISN